MKFLVGDFSLFQVYKSDMETAIAMVDVEEKVEYMVERKSGAEHNMEDAADKIKADAKAMSKKVTDPDRDIETEYIVEKVKEKLD